MGDKLTELGRRLLMLIRRGRFDADLEEEMRLHRELREQEQIERGLSPKEAHYAVQGRFGNDLVLRERSRDMWGWTWLENFMQDVRHGLRQLRRSPGFTCAAVFILGLGISAAVTMFAFVDAALIRPLPYKDQARLVGVFESSGDNSRSIVSYLDFVDWKRLNHVFSSIDAYALNGSFTLATRSGAEQVPGTRVSAGFFHTLGVAPVMGHDFRPGDDRPDTAPTVLLSYSAWQARFGGTQDVIGKSIILNGASATIIGVLPREFAFAPYGQADLWGNLRGADACEQSRACHNLIAIARLKDGVSTETASADMRSIVQRLRDEYPESNRDSGSADLVPLRELVVGDVRPILLVSLAGAGLLFLIACVNVTALLLARSEKRQREIAVRGALGASSSRLIRQFAAEGLVLAALGDLLALLFAGWEMRLLTDLVPPAKMESMPYLRGLHLNLLTMGFGCSAVLLASALFAVIPIARVSLSAILAGLKEGIRGSAGRAWRRLGSSLVVAEVAIATTLMLAAGLLGKSFYLLVHLDVGFNPDHLAAVQTSWAPGRYATDLRQVTLGRQIMARISRLPGVQSVALSNAPPIDSAWGSGSFHIAGRPNHGESNEVLQRHVSSTHFTTLKARLARGRYFREDEDASKPPVAIINRTLAAKYFRDVELLGKQIYWDWQPKSLVEIVGIVDDIKEGTLAGAAWPTVYVPQNQSPWAWPAVLVRTSQRESALFPEITRAIHGLDPFISVYQAQTMTERIDQSPSAYLHRSSASLAGGFAIVAFVLSVVGLYGVVAYSVSQRTREIGIRMALGAERSVVLRLMMKQAAWITVLGIALGLLFSLFAATFMRTLLFGVRSWDVPTLAAVAAVLSISALVAGYVPARRATEVDPMVALRCE